MHILASIREKIAIIKKQPGFSAVFFLVLFISTGLRIWNVFTYNTWWADDGGAHVAYIDVIQQLGRLPTPAETYLAWHEPLFYVLAAVWAKIVAVFGFSGLNWVELLQVGIFICLFLVVWRLACFVVKEKWLSLAVTTLFSFLFVTVKLSAYLTNELLAQTMILLLMFIFVKKKLYQTGKGKLVFWWSMLLGVALLVKLTAVIVLLAAFLIWGLRLFVKRDKSWLAYIGIALVVAGSLQAPWLLHKQQAFGKVFSINLFEQEKQSVMTSDGWEYILRWDHTLFSSYPYWLQGKPSFLPIVVADTVGDYYNLFTNVDRLNRLPDEQKLVTTNGRPTEWWRVQRLLLVNKIGLVFASILLIGLFGTFFGEIRQLIKEKQIHWDRLFVWIMITGGWSALLYNNLRHPYPERGILKIQFILFVLPLMMIVSTGWWRTFLPKKWVIWLAWGLVLVYGVVAWPVLVVW